MPECSHTGSLPEVEKLDIASQIARGLEFMASQKVLSEYRNLYVTETINYYRMNLQCLIDTYFTMRIFGETDLFQSEIYLSD